MDRSKTGYLTLLGVVSACAVVFLHTNGVFWWFSTTEHYWPTANVIENICYFAVPIFFMISGATLMEYRDRYDTKTFFKKRINKTVIPYLIWSIVGMFYNILYLETGSLSDINAAYVLKGLSNNSFINLYWFFPALFGVYLSMPLLSAISEKLRKQVLTYLAVAGFVINVLLPFVHKVFWPDNYFPVSVAVMGGYLLYTVIGYLLFKYETPPKLEILIYVLAAVLFFVQLEETYRLSMAAGSIVTTYKEYVNVPCVLYSIAVFLFFKNHVRVKADGKFMKVISFIGQYTFSIYLLHYFIMTFMVRHFVIDQRSIVYRLGAPFIIIPICILIAFVIRKIPGLKRVLP